MKRYNTKAIVIKRVNYQEADRILTLITSTNGKISAIARGVRKPKSKLAGGIELFSVCDLTLIEGKSNLHTITSSRTYKSFSELIKDYDLLNSAYQILKRVDQYTNDDSSEEYYNILEASLELLDRFPEKRHVISGWLYMQLLKLHGSNPNLTHDIKGNQLDVNKTYSLSIEDGGFFESEFGPFTSNEIKAWRIFLQATPNQLIGISGLNSPAIKTIDYLDKFSQFQI